MIRVELRSVPEGAHSYLTVASMSVADDGTYRFDDPDGLFPVDLHVLVAGEDGQLRRVTLEEDPASWARNLGTVLRTGYLVPAVTDDTVAGHAC